MDGSLSFASIYQEGMKIKMPTRKEKLDALVRALRDLPGVRAVGLSGDPSEAGLDGARDIDLFVYCDSVPGDEARAKAYRALSDLFDGIRMRVCDCEAWGIGDILDAGGVDVMPMYFQKGATEAFVAEVRAGKRATREGGFYPVGRLATIAGMHVYFDEDRWLNRMREMLSVYPDSLREETLRAHVCGAWDGEEFESAARRRDVFFFHHVLDEAMDSFLQALFALNRVYFPSRKRSEQDMNRLPVKPRDCAARMRAVLVRGASGDTVAEAAEMWRALVEELVVLASA